MKAYKREFGENIHCVCIEFTDSIEPDETCLLECYQDSTLLLVDDEGQGVGFNQKLMRDFLPIFEEFARTGRITKSLECCQFQVEEGRRKGKGKK